MRCFIAVEIPEDLKEKITDIQKRFSRFDIKLVERENLHINLSFLGEADDKIDQIKEIIDKIALKPFKISIRKIGVFPGLDYIKVVWLGIESKELEVLYDSLNSSLKNIGLGEERKFTPHLTLGRMKSARDKEKLIKLINELKDAEIGEFEANEIILFESELTPNGPVYEKVYSKKV